MEPNSAYDLFLHTGKVADYLNYINAKQPPAVPQGAAEAMQTGENGAYYDRGDRAAGAHG